MARALTLVWTEPALDDLDQIAAFIALDDPTAAAELVERALSAVERLRRFPQSGRTVPELGGRTHREVIVPPLRIVYRREKQSILIVYVTRGEKVLRPTRLR